MEKKINLEDIISKYEIIGEHYADQDFDEQSVINICLEFGNQLLQLAAENACLKSEMIPYGGVRLGGSYVSKVVDKESITNTIKQIE